MFFRDLYSSSTHYFNAPEIVLISDQSKMYLSHYVYISNVMGGFGFFYLEILKFLGISLHGFTYDCCFQ